MTDRNREKSDKVKGGAGEGRCGKGRTRRLDKM